MSDFSNETPVRPLVLGTAGHVDHGKTTLVRWLTGIDTDRLPEEKERGITIELGFAHLDLDGCRLGVVDVPGHERFIRAMAAGAAGVDLVLLVVAADEGVMPQTREHLGICALLGVQAGLVVLTKADLVEPDWLELVREDVAQLLAGTFLAAAPILTFSATDPAQRESGVAGIRQALRQLVAQARTADPRRAGAFRLPIDRVFTLHGFGTVVTGTCAAGALAEGEAVEVLPSGLRSRVRGLQAYGQPVARVTAGQRVAVNLQGAERQAVERGETLVRAGELGSSAMLDVRVTLLGHLERPLGAESRLLLHHGAAQVEAVLALLDADELPPGGSALAQLRLAQPLVALPGDRFLLRGFARHEQHGTTVGGGVVLLAHPARHRRRERAEAAAALAAVERGGPPALLEELLRQAGPQGRTVAELVGALGWSAAAVAAALEQLAATCRLLGGEGEGGARAHVATLEQLRPRLEQLLRDHHRDHPRKAGLEREELLSRLPELVGARCGKLLLQRLVEQGVLAQDGVLLRLASFTPQRDAEGERRKEELARLLGAAGLAPPTGDELRAPLGCTPAELAQLLAELVAEGRVVRVRDDFHVAAPTLAELEERLVAWLREHGEISPGEFKALVGASRRFVIPLAEHFDRAKVTLRVGDQRKLRRG